jgi:hypothetical protein
MKCAAFSNWPEATQTFFATPGMSISPIERVVPLARQVAVSDTTLAVELADGRSIAVPLEWFPRLVAGTRAERSHWRIIGRGEGIHWPELDEDIEVEALLAGTRSSETQRSLDAWLNSRSKSTR